MGSVPGCPHALVRQADVVLRERRLRGGRTGDVCQLGELHPAAEVALFREAVQELGHPPREALGFPDAAERAGGILFKF